MKLVCDCVMGEVFCVLELDGPVARELVRLGSVYQAARRLEPQLRRIQVDGCPASFFEGDAGETGAPDLLWAEPPAGWNIGAGTTFPMEEGFTNVQEDGVWFIVQRRHDDVVVETDGLSWERIRAAAEVPAA
jgi:hypothetical protein